MNRISPYQITYTRVGAQESWAGWRIAGQSENTPDSVLDECARIQDSNAGDAGVLFDNLLAREIFEWVCNTGISKGETVYFSKLRFGMLDDAGDRPSMRSDTVALPVGKELELLKRPQVLLNIDRESFNNHLSIDSKRDENGQLIKSLVSSEDANTVYSDKSFSTDDSFSLSDTINQIFGSNFSNYSLLIKCVYWAITFNSASTIYIVMPGNIDDKFRLFSLIINSIVQSLRSLLSFRTCDLPTSFPTTFVLSDRHPDGERFFDVRDGSNNIISDAVEKKLSRLTFIENSLSNIKSGTSEHYFEALNQSLSELGDCFSKDVRLINIADIFVSEGNVSDLSNAENKEIRKKLLKFLQLQVKSDKIDEYIADLIEIVLNRKIELNEDVQTLIEEKLARTECDKLIDIGYRYKASRILQNPDRESAFDELYKTRKNMKVFMNIKDSILSFENGTDFIDLFYAEYYGSRDVKTREDIIYLCDETRGLYSRKAIINFMIKKCTSFGEEILKQFIITKKSLVAEFNEFTIFIQEVFSNNTVVSDRIINGLKQSFWKSFIFTNYIYDNAPSYRMISYRSDERYSLCSRLTEIFDDVDKMNISSVESLKKLVNKSTILNSSEKTYLLTQYQKHCLSLCNDKSHKIDFWITLSTLTSSSPAKFLYTHRMPVFRDEGCFDAAVTDSDLLKNPAFLKAFIDDIEMLKKNEDDKSLGIIINKLKRLLSNIEKEEKKSTKKEKKPEKTRAVDDFSSQEDGEQELSVPHKSQKAPKHAETTNESKGFLGGLFKKKKDKDRK